MNDQDRLQFEAMQRDIRGIKDDLHILMTNHLAHIKIQLDDLDEKVDQTYGIANDAAQKSSRTEKAVALAIAFFGLIMALIECLGG